LVVRSPTLVTTCVAKFNLLCTWAVTVYSVDISYNSIECLYSACVLTATQALYKSQLSYGLHITGSATTKLCYSM